MIAARNEEDNIGKVVREALLYGDVIVVDNASEDSTALLAESEGAVVIRHAINTHIKESFIDGFRFILKQGYKRVIQMDAGLSHSPYEIPRLIKGLDSAPMVIGSRFMPESYTDQKASRWLLSRGGTFLVRTLIGIPFTDVTSGFRAFDASLLKDLDERGVLDGLKSAAHAFQFELLWRIVKLGYEVHEVPITYRAGKSSLRIGTVGEALQTLARLIVTQ